MLLKDLIQELRSFLDTIESNLNICDNFFEIKQQINIILQKLINLDKGQINKIVFIGRQGSRKTEIITNLSECLPSICVIKYKSDKYALDNRGYEDESGDFETNTKFMDTPFYNYSDELDNEILNNCCDANIFVVVTNAVGSIGDLDKNFLKKISNNVFVIKLIFIFTGMEKVSENERYQLTVQHKTNAIKIANEILSVPQENIPIFFTYNNELDADKFLSNCTFKISLKCVMMFAASIQRCHEELKAKIKEIREPTVQKSLHEEKFPQVIQNAEDYLQVILDLYSNHLLKYANEDTKNSIISKESLISNLEKFWPESVDFVENSDSKLNSMAFNTFMFYTNKQFKSINQVSRNIRDNIEEIVREVNHIYELNFHEYYNSDNAQSLINKCETLIDFSQQTENLLLIKEILCFFIFIELILKLISIEQTNKHNYVLYSISRLFRCKENQFYKNMQLLKYIFFRIKDLIEIIKNCINTAEIKVSNPIIIEQVKSSSFIQFNGNLSVKMVNPIQNIIRQHVDIFDLDKSDVGH